MQRALSRLKFEDLTTVNDAMARCLRLAALAASSDVPVVLLGETGTGKTLLAHAMFSLPLIVLGMAAGLQRGCRKKC